MYTIFILSGCIIRFSSMSSMSKRCFHVCCTMLKNLLKPFGMKFAVSPLVTLNKSGIPSNQSCLQNIVRLFFFRAGISAFSAVFPP